MGGRRFFLEIWSKVHVRGIVRRCLRLELVAGLGIALAMPALAMVPTATTTTLTAGTLSGCSQPLSIAVTANGQPVTSGIVTINDVFNGVTPAVQLGSVSLSSSGTATPTISLAAGTHLLVALFAGNSSDQASDSSSVSVSVTSECEFTVAVSNFNPASTSANNMTLTAGQAGSATVAITPSVEFTSTLTAPMFVTLSCSGLPDQASCNFTPANVEILSTTPESCPNGSVASACPPTSTMVIQTYAASTASVSPATRQGKGSAPIAWAFLLPGTFGLGGLAWGARRRRWFSRLSLMAVIGLVTLLGTTACNPRYGYEHHSPVPNPPTPAGSYTVTVTAQSTNGVTAITQETSFVLTVN
jgi:hypothetical protein